MRTISQVAQLTGISVRTLQYYDEIGLLKPTKLTQSGYRLYDEEALQHLQQILFFKELGFKLKDINEILHKSDFDRISAFKAQKEMLLIKRNRIDRLIQLLNRLEKGEQCMSFKEFDMSDYFQALENFKNNNLNEIIKHWGSVENFEFFVQKLKADESNVAKLAIQEFGSIEKYTEAMKYNLEHFSGIMDRWHSQIPEEMKNKDLFQTLASHKKEDVTSTSVQNIVQEIINYAHGNTGNQFAELVETDTDYCKMMIDIYSNDYSKRITDTKFGIGSSDYIVKAFRYYLEKHPTKKLCP